MEYEVVVIGAGIGGLTAAAVLAKRGLNVCLLERQSYAGGCAAVVEHAGYQFEPTHGLYCGWEPDGVFARLFGELAAPAPSTRMLSTPYLVRLPDGSDVARITHEDFEVSLHAAFPECGDAAIEFYRELTSANPSELKMRAHLGSCSARFRGFIDIQLKTLTQCASIAHKLAASALAPQRSFWQIEGGVQSLIDTLIGSFRHSGGKLRLSSAVLRLAYGPDGSPIGVDLLNGERVVATRAIVSNLTIWDTYGKLIGPARTPRQISATLKGMRAFGSYQMFLTIAEPALSALPADRILLLTDFRDGDSAEPEEAQLTFSLSLSAKGKAGGTDCTAVVSAYTDAEDWFSFHEDLTAFEARDQAMLEKVWTRLHSAMPELGAAVELIETATPQTFYETTRRRFGTIGRPTPIATESLAAKPFPNLWLVGDTVAESFGVDGIIESALHVAHQITS
jgi:phytoene dehydrogenase-like protein